MTTIVTRAGKGSPLTNSEVDTNFTNLNDAKIETLTSTDASVTITGTGSSRDLSVPVNPNVVSGPASATDNAITRFDGTTGKLVQNSTVTLDDNGNVINANSLGFDTTPATVPTTVGTMSWDDGDGVPIVALKGGNVNLQVGTQELARVYNDSGTTLTKGQVVYISGSQGNRVAVKLARADVEATSFGTIGLVAETMTSGSEGFIIVSGALYKLDTSGLIAGATVYLSPTTAGSVTTTKPQAPDQLVVVGWVERVDNTVGSIYVKIDNGYELDELHDVQITSPQSGNILIYDATTSPIGVWKNANLTDGTGITITEGAGSITIANTGVTQATAGTGISVSAGTGNVTISNTGVLSVSGTAGRTTSSGGTTPAIDLASGIVTAGTTGSATQIPVITVDTYGRVTSVTTAANPQGTVTSVGGTGTVNGITLTGTVTSSGSLTLGGTLSGVNLATQVTGTLPIANGGSGQTTAQAAMNSFAGAVTSGQYLRGNGTNVVMSAIQAGDVPTLNQNTTGSAATLTTGRTISATGDISYTSGSFNGSANVTGTATLATVNSNVGTFGSASSIPVVTVNGKGLVTAVSTATVAGGQYFGTAATKAIAYNANSISENITVTTGNNGLSAGPITINSGFTVTVQTGAAWVIV